jgi:DNA polymerase-3 subunit epsilon
VTLISPVRLTRGGMSGLDFTVIDFETTALSPGRIIEVGAVRMRGDGTVLAELSTLVDPGPGVDPGATWVHRITREQLDGAPSMRDVIGPLLSFCEGSVVVAHNLEFEARFFARELDLLGIGVASLPGLCTLQAARSHLTMPNYRLASLVELLELPAVATHAALDDARACGRLLAALFAEPYGLGIATPPRFVALPRQSGTTRFKPRVSKLRAGSKGWMACLMDRLPVSNVGDADPAMVAVYVETLTDALADGRITGEEAKILAAQAGQAGMSRVDLERLHREVLAGLRRVAEEDDVITKAEAAELKRAAAALGMPDFFADLAPDDTVISVRPTRRVLILGTGTAASEARRLAMSAGVEVAQRLTARVTEVVIDHTVGETEPRLAKARMNNTPVSTVEEFIRSFDAAIPTPPEPHAISPQPPPISTAATPPEPSAPAVIPSPTPAAAVPAPAGQTWSASPVFAEPSQIPPPSATQARPSAWSIAWALVPLLTLGLLTSVIVGHASIRLRSRTIAVTGALYAIATVCFMTLATIYPDGSPPVAANAVMLVCFLGPWLGGTVQAFTLRRRMFTPNTAAANNQTAEDYVRYRARLRAQARQIAAMNPVYARELRIGRPDLPRTYDDGGLIDINHAPTQLLVGLPGITAPIAQQITELRQQRGPFVSAEDVAASILLDPHLVPQLAEYTVYIP